MERQMTYTNQENGHMQKGFTLIELMVVIVIIGILSALAIPKMFGVSAKAKAAEAPGVIANWETLQSAYSQETGTSGLPAAIGFQQPGTITSATVSNTMWFTYTAAVASLTAAVNAPGFGSCTTGDNFVTTYASTTDTNVHTAMGSCQPSYAPNF
jgi:type IV pilus assembly protein PilA